MGSDWRTSFGLMARLLLSRLGTLKSAALAENVASNVSAAQTNQRLVAIEFLRRTDIHLYMRLYGTN